MLYNYEIRHFLYEKSGTLACHNFEISLHYDLSYFKQLVRIVAWKGTDFNVGGMYATRKNLSN